MSLPTAPLHPRTHYSRSLVIHTFNSLARAERSALSSRLLRAASGKGVTPHTPLNISLSSALGVSNPRCAALRQGSLESGVRCFNCGLGHFARLGDTWSWTGASHTPVNRGSTRPTFSSSRYPFPSHVSPAAHIFLNPVLKTVLILSFGDIFCVSYRCCCCWPHAAT